MVFKSLIEIAHERNKHKRSCWKSKLPLETITYGVHKQKGRNGKKDTYRVALAIPEKHWKEARLRFGDAIDVKLDFNDGLGYLERIDNPEIKYPTLCQKNSGKNKKRIILTALITFRWTDDMPFIRRAEKLHNVEVADQQIWFEFSDKQLAAIGINKKIEGENYETRTETKTDSRAQINGC